MLANLVSPATAPCPGAEAGPDGICIHCGRRARYEAAYGREVHVRGRIKGRSYPVAARTVRQERRSCPDCGCGLQEIGGRLRCPWTTSTRRRFDGDAIACDWPYDRRGVAA